MVSTQPLPDIQTSSLRLVPPVQLDRDNSNVPVIPIFDLMAPTASNAQMIPFPLDWVNTEPTPFSYDDFAELDDIQVEEPIASLLTEDDEPPPAPKPATSTLRQQSEHGLRQTGFLNGVSLSAILQMLHLERKTCVVDVSAHGWLGKLTLVNGELVDAVVDDCTGEEAAVMIMNWARPQATILDGVELFRHTVQKPITQLIMDAVRIGDETGMLDPGKLPEFDRPVGANPNGDWRWLVDSLTLAGALNVRLVFAESQGQRGTGNIGDGTGDLARGIRTWAALLGPDVSEIVATRAGRTVILTALDDALTLFIYAEAAGPETVAIIRRSLRSVKHPR